MKIFRKFFRKILSITILPFLKVYLSKTRNYHYQGIQIAIPPKVFHPAFFFSTQFLLQYIQSISLQGKSFLELGAGSGLISFYANKQGAIVTASDISEVAIINLIANQKSNHQKFDVIHSNLFQNFPNVRYDYVVINPPYYKKNPKREEDYAWYCGEKLEYFENLFKDLKGFVFSKSCIIMVLSEDCDITQIIHIANQYGFVLIERKRKRIWFERNFIFEIQSKAIE